MPSSRASSPAPTEKDHPVYDSFAADIAARARWARDHNDGQPNPAWSTGEKLTVALVLRNQAYLRAATSSAGP